MGFPARIKKSLVEFKEATKRELIGNRVRRPVLIFPAFLFLVPLIFRDEVLLRWFVEANYVALFAASWDLLVFSGYISFGHQSFFAMGCYTVAMVSLYYNISIGQWWILLPLGALMAFLLGFALGIPCLRWRGPYLILATAVFPSLFEAFITMGKETTGGTEGIPGKLFPGRSLDPVVNTSNFLYNQTMVYYFSLVLLLLAVIFMVIIAYSKRGLVWQAIRENEPAADAAGIDTTRNKVYCFVLSCLFAGLAGAFYVGNVSSTISPAASLRPGLQTDAMTASILGGVSSIVGAVGGAYILTFISYAISILGDWFPILLQLRNVIKGAILGIVFFIIPEGIFRRIYYHIRFEILRELG